MDYLIGEIMMRLAAVAAVFCVIGWILHGMFGQSKLRVLEINKNVEIENLEADLESAQKAHTAAATAMEKAYTLARDTQTRLEVASKDAASELATAKSKHQTEVGKLKTRIASLESLEAGIAERDARIEGWQKRFEGFVHEKDEMLAALKQQLTPLLGLPAELIEHKGKLAAMGAALAAAEAHKDSLSTHLNEHRTSLEAAQAQLQTLTSERDSSIAALQMQLNEAEKQASEMKVLVDQRYEAVKSEDPDAVPVLEARVAHLLAALTERDAVLAEHRSKVEEKESKLNALASEHQSKLAEVTSLVSQRDEQLKSFDQRMRGATAEKDTVIGKLRAMVAQIEPLRAELQQRDQTIEQMQTQLSMSKAGSHAEFDEAQRHILSMSASNQSMKTALEGKDAEIAVLLTKASSLPAPSAIASEPRAPVVDDRISSLEKQAVDTAGRHAAAKSELNEWTARYAALEAQLRQQSADHQTALQSLEAKQQELDRAKAEVASLDAKLMSALATGAVAEPAHVAPTAQAAPSAPDELAALHARVATLEKALDDEVPREAKLRSAIAANESELTELRGQIADRDERLEAWDSRFHASLGELHGEVGMLTANARAYQADLQNKDQQIVKLQTELALAPLAMAAAAGAGSSSEMMIPPQMSVGFTSSTPSPTNDESRTTKRLDDARKLQSRLESGLSMSGVQFLPKSAELIPQALPILEQAAEAIHEIPDVSIEIAGHTDSWGQPQDNFRLSQHRAGAVKEFLINRGIAAWRLIDVGYGDTQPVDSNDSPDGRFRNRRIELHVRQ